MAYENPAATQEKIDAIVFKKMYNTYRNEIEVRTGKKSPEKKIIKEETGIDEKELISKLEAALKAKKAAQEMLNEEDHKTSIKENETLFKSRKDRTIKKTVKHEETYPLEYDSYKKIIEKKKEESLLERKEDDFKQKSLDRKNFSKSQQANRQYFNQNRKEFLNSLTKIHPAVKYEYTHPGTFVSLYLILDRICF